MRILAGVGKKLGGDKPGVECMARVDVAVARTMDCQVHPCFRTERADHLANFLQKIPEVYPIAIVGERQGLVEFRRDLDACVDVVEQYANLPGRKGFAALENSVALKANNAAEAGQVVRESDGPPQPVRLSRVRSKLTFCASRLGTTCALKGRQSRKQ